MATNLLVLLDDIATVLDDVIVMSKVAAKKTAGVLGDDLALNAQQVSGVKADRELPVVWAVAKGSALNKLILVPAALLISYFMPWLITPLLMIGGAYLCFEGFEKIAHKFLHSKEEDEAHHAEQLKALSDPNIDMVDFEKDKIKGAIRTDFILSAEIVVIALGTVDKMPFINQALVVSLIAIVMTVGVYSIVAGIVKLDDAGLYLLKAQAQNTWGKIKRSIGSALLWFAPRLMKTLSIVGTAAMFMVGGGILVHGLPHSHDVLLQASGVVENTPVIGGILAILTEPFINALMGIIAGAFVLIIVLLTKKLLAKK